MKSIVLLSVLILMGTSSSLCGEFPKATRVSDISGIWESTSLGRYVRLIVQENGEGTLISMGVGNQIQIYTIKSITFVDDSFDFTIILVPAGTTAEEQSYSGVLWFSRDSMLFFHHRTAKPMADPPLFSFLREDTFKALSESAKKKLEDLEK